MNRKLKAMGLAVVAALALTAVMAAAAQADFTSSTSHTILSGSQSTSHEFTAGEGFGAIKCATAKFAGTGNATTEEDITIIPTYENCKDSFGRTADLTPHEFEYTFTTDGTVHVRGTMIISITSGGSTICTVTILAQTDNGITYHNTEDGSVLVTANTTNVVSTTSGGFFNCGISNGEHKNGTYTGSTIMTGKGTDGSTSDLTVDHPTEF